MGHALIGELRASADLGLAGAWERPGFDGTVPPGLVLAKELESLAGQLDLIIDFTAPDATARHADWCAEHGVAMVVGTTGMEAPHHAALNRAAERIAVMQAPNMSVGVSALCELLATATRMLPDFDMEIVETHHRHKKDAPSGTAMRLLEILQANRADTRARFERHGIIGARPESEIGVQTLRGGDVVGEHTVFYYGDGERLELTHRATDRRIFAAGAIRAARWLHGKPAGRYNMSDVLLS